MDNELRFLLEQGPTSVKELARLAGKSTSTIYKAIKHPDVQETSVNDGPRLYFVKPSAPVAVPESTAPVSAPVPPATAAAVAPAPSKRGRKPTAQGQKLFPSATLLGGADSPPTYQNPRRKTSAGFKSLQIIIDSPGISAEDYVSKGGRLNDLRWDIAHGNVKAE